MGGIGILSLMVGPYVKLVGSTSSGQRRRPAAPLSSHYTDGSWNGRS